jgi:putative tributyrin esterase
MRRTFLSGFIVAVLGTLLACERATPPLSPDHPRLAPGVALLDVTFHSAALNRDMPYRVILPKQIAIGKKLPVVYLLHGGGGGFHDWSNYSEVAQYAERGVILVMPEGNSSYYMNAADRPHDRYEDYIVKDLLADVESRFPAATERAKRAIMGVSMGGFGAVALSLSHPELFSFAAGISSAIDVPSRPFSIKRIGQWRDHRAIFGPWQSETRHSKDPFVLARTADPATIPYLFLTCGDKEGLMPANRKFAVLLRKRNYDFEFREVSGGHDWNQWDRGLAEVYKSMFEHIRMN